MENEFDLIEYKDSKFETLKIGIFCWIAAFMALFIPIFAIPFVLIAISKSINIKSNLMKVISFVVAAFVLVLCINYVITFIDGYKEIGDEMISQSSEIRY